MERICLIPAVLAVLYAFFTLWRAKNTTNSIFIFIGGSIATTNALLVYEMCVSKDDSVYINIIQQILSCAIVPIAYMYFAKQMGKKWANNITTLLWALSLLLLVPSGFYSLDCIAPHTEYTTIEPMTIHLFSKGQEIYQLCMADIIITIQTLITLIRLLLMIYTLGRYKIVLSPKIKLFLYWWSLAIIFIIYISTLSIEEFCQPHILWIYFIVVSVLTTSNFILISLNLNLHPVMLKIKMHEMIQDYDGEQHAEEDISNTTEGRQIETEAGIEIQGDDLTAFEDQEDIIVEDIDTFLQQTRFISEQVKMILKDKSRCLDSKLTTDSMIRELGTNRTYFYRIIKAEFGCSFNDLLLQHRMDYALNMLKTTNIPIGDIAMHCGFSGSNSFARRFRQIYGISPSQFRMDNQQ